MGDVPLARGRAAHLRCPGRGGSGLGDEMGWDGKGWGEMGWSEMGWGVRNQL